MVYETSSAYPYSRHIAKVLIMPPKTYQEYCDIVNSPGKFQGEKPYVPYFWDMLPAEIDEDISIFTVQSEDIDLFPELQGKIVVKLQEWDNGFIVEL